MERIAYYVAQRRRGIEHVAAADHAVGAAQVALNEAQARLTSAKEELARARGWLATQEAMIVAMAEREFPPTNQNQNRKGS